MTLKKQKHKQLIWTIEDTSELGLNSETDHYYRRKEYLYTHILKPASTVLDKLEALTQIIRPVRSNYVTIKYKIWWKNASY